MIFVNFVYFNGSVVFFFVCFMIFLSRWRYALVVVVYLFFDLFCGLCLCPCGVSPDVVLCLWRVCFPVCVCVVDCGGPVWADL